MRWEDRCDRRSAMHDQKLMIPYVAFFHHVHVHPGVCTIQMRPGIVCSSALDGWFPPIRNHNSVFLQKKTEVYSIPIHTRTYRRLHVEDKRLTLSQQHPSLVVAWRNLRRDHLGNSLVGNSHHYIPLVAHWLLGRKR
jgi:hypothetical protein